MAVLSFVVLLGFSLTFCECQNLKSRLDFLEMQVSRESYKTRSDIIQLREVISAINATGALDGGVTVDNSAMETRLDELEVKMERFIDNQRKTTVAISRAITEEKTMMRKMLKIIQDLADSNTQSVLEIEEALDQSEKERDMFRKEWEMFEDEIKNDLNDVSNDTRMLNEKFENFDGNIIIQNFEKKLPCPKTWVKQGNTCYLYQEQEKLNWFGARIRCHDFGGKLVEPDSKGKMNRVLSTIKGDNIWIGATDDDHEGQWVWASSQKPLEPYVKWQPGQPNNLYGYQNCLEIGLLSVNDESCLEDNNYICEMPVAS